MDKRYISVDTLSTTTQAFTTSWVDYGAEVETHGVKTLNLWVDLDINSTNDARIRVLGKMTKGATNEYNMVIKKVNTTEVQIDDHYIEFHVDADQKAIIPIDLNYAFPFVQVQVSCGTVGATAGEIESIYMTKVLE